MALSPCPNDNSSLLTERQGVYDDASRVAVWGLGINLLLAALKLAGGFMTGSSALLADAVNSIGDVASSVAVRVSLHIAQKDEDEDHPYGHTKAESIAGLSVALIISFSAGVLAIETLGRLSEKAMPVTALAGIVAAVCAIIKETAYRYTKNVANRLHSTSLGAAALDHRSDAISSALVAVALLCSQAMGRWAVYVDPIVAAFVCVYLIYAGVNLFIGIAGELMDQQADEQTIKVVRRVAESVEDVVEVEKLRVRKSGLEFFAEIHVQVEGHLTVNEGHRIGHEVKDRLLKEVPRLRDVHIHIEPHEPSWNEPDSGGSL